MVVKLTDHPGDYDEVNVDLEQVEIHMAPTDTTSKDTGWIALATNKGVYDLLKLQDVKTVIAKSTSFPTGKLTQIRLVLTEAIR